MGKYQVIVLGDLDASRRLDRLLKRFLLQVPSSFLYRAIRKGDVRLNGLKVTPETLTFSGDVLEIYKPLLAYVGEGAVQARSLLEEPSLLKVNIVFENNDFLIINKDAGVLVVPGKDNRQATLKDWILSYKPHLFKNSLSFCPAPLHRLDRNTSGLLVFSLSLKGAQDFSLSLKKREIEKSYLALVEGYTPKIFDWSSPLVYDHRQEKAVLSSQHGKSAITKGRTLASCRAVSLVELKIETGLTHQIRACAGLRGYPLLGDKKYGSSAKTNSCSYYLHAHSLVLPADWLMEQKQFTASLPRAWFREPKIKVLQNVLEKYL